MIGLHELKEIKHKITAIVFRHDQYNMESIIRWIYDRGFAFDNFSEEGLYYLIIQPCSGDYKYRSYERIKGYNIAVEIGEVDEDRDQDVKELDRLIGPQ